MTGIWLLLGIIYWIAWIDAREIDNFGKFDE